MVPTQHQPQTGTDVSRLRTAAQIMIEAYQRLQMAQQAARRAVNALDLAKDDFSNALMNDEGFDDLLSFRADNGKLWIIKVDEGNGNVISINPAMEVD